MLNVYGLNDKTHNPVVVLADANKSQGAMSKLLCSRNYADSNIS